MMTSHDPPRSIPRAPRWPLVGSLPQLLRHKYALLSDYHRRYGDVYELHLGPTPTIALCSPELAEEFLTEKIDHYNRADPISRAVRDFLGNGLFFSQGADWRRQRRLANPAFHHDALRRILADMQRVVDSTLDEWTAARLGRPFDFAEAVVQLAIEIVLTALFGGSADRSTVRRITPSFRHIVEHILPGAFGKMLPAWLPMPGRSEFEGHLASMHSLIDGIVRQRIGEPDRESHDLLGMLLAARDDDGRGLTVEQLRDQMTTLLLAGSETTAGALTWLMLELGPRQGVLDNLRADARRIADSGSTFQELTRDSYTRAVCMEVLRMHPPAWLITRRAISEHELGGWAIHPGDDVALLVYSVHRHPDHWVEPERFDPNRFLQGAKRHKLAWMPFGGGQRICIGKDFALMEMALILSRLLARFDVAIDERRLPEPIFRVPMKLDGGVWLELRPRAEG